ncbi:EAL domain-containing protein [Psychrosphaera sp. B3R10]|uniref:putative bifunctional diguanylate cyclase/phosphodiesterase n=1 Tax=unclassified Psychrosphaera TaxID=2641570 RepID=UPI001C08A0ED|nr:MULTISPECIES: GGDEF and EAL domain-containing protein [unclassified Psychrosphaera]MBU2882893.1 EAL domain-containing protein [Psychrosphaera sp. I2R16]MBU2991290.1 EAL domain-containing protein [Psychrosphaera sp. B3R10]
MIDENVIVKGNPISNSERFQLQNKTNRTRQLLIVLMVVVTIVLINDSIFLNMSNLYEHASTLILMGFFYKFLSDDTTNEIVSLLMWTLVILASYFCWKNDGLYDTAILIYPCILIGTSLLSGSILLFSLLAYMVCSLYGLAWVTELGVIDAISVTDNSIWAKANNLALVLFFYTISLRFLTNENLKLITRLVTENEKTQEAQAKAKVAFDLNPLTNLPNEHIFAVKTNAAIEKNTNGPTLIALITIDQKNLKWINSTLGYEVGNKYIQALSERLQILVGKKASLFHLSGNEFSFLLEANGYDEISQFVQDIVSINRQPILIDDNELEIQNSIGIALFPFDGKSYEILRTRSLIALSHAHSLESREFNFFEMEMESQLKKRSHLSHALKSAIENEEFELYYQPKIHLESNEIVGAEALLRWKTKTGEFITPNDFIPIAESSGLISPIGKQVLMQACRDCKEWHSKTAQQIQVSVNISPYQFRRGNLPNIVHLALNKSELAPRFLELEITESIVFDDTDSVKDQLHTITKRGASIAIDDFGTGYSNLSYISQFNASTLKIDMSFVLDIMDSPLNKHLVNAILQMSKSLDIENVAEGIENKQTSLLLKELGCTYGQGFYWSKPIPQQEFIQFLINYKAQGNGNVTPIRQAN